MDIKYFRLASDLHLEQFLGMPIEPLAQLTLEAHEKDRESILVLAGDVSADPGQLVDFIGHVESRFLRVVFTPGNHEYYRHEIGQWNEYARQLFAQKTRNTSVSIGEVRDEQIGAVRFIFGTLWADGGQSLQEEERIECTLNDFRHIRLGNADFTVQDMKRLHGAMKADIARRLRGGHPGSPTVVVTHHLPSYTLCHPRFASDCNGGYASDCDEMLASQRAPDLWVFGHTHDTIDRMVCNTRVCANPRGYVREVNASEHNYYGPLFLALSELHR